MSPMSPRIDCEWPVVEDVCQSRLVQCWCQVSQPAVGMSLTGAHDSRGSTRTRGAGGISPFHVEQRQHHVGAEGRRPR